jgi:FHS family L-fucose permease-like MFS transporter
MKTYSPATIMKFLAFVAVVFASIAVFVGGMAGCLAVVGISGCMSLMFPTIYGLGLSNVGQDTKLGGSGIIMGIAGGAVFPFIQAAIIDTFKSSDNYNQVGNQSGYIVQIICFSLIAIYSVYARKIEKQLGI